MPKSSPTHSPPSSSAIPKPVSEVSGRMSDVAIRKKKNADAQAAFRARRANYIATLEETGSDLWSPDVLARLTRIDPVTNLESVVLQLQESCRDSRNENLELRQENSRLRVEHREREKFWRTLYNAKKSGRAPEVDDLQAQPLVSSPFMGHAQGTGLPSQLTPVIIHQPYGLGNGMGYRGEDACQGSYNAPASGGGANYSNQAPSVPFLNSNELSANGSAGSPLGIRGTKYAGYPYPLSRDGRWQVPPSMPSGVPVGDPSTTPPHSQSPAYMDSPTLTTSSEMVGYSGRYSEEEQQKSSLNSILENAPYVFPNSDRFHQTARDNVPDSRSMSPTSSTPSSSTSLPLTSSFQFAFQDPTPGQERADFDYRRHSLPHCPEVTLHGGTADISLTGQSSDAVRYPVGRRPDSAIDHLPMLENNAQQDMTGNDAEIPPQFRARRHTIHSSHLHSQSPSPGPSISCTVAVIKAQAFGALRRTRTRARKNSQGAAKVAMDVLEARGIGVSAGSKRARLDNDDFDADTP